MAVGTRRAPRRVRRIHRAARQSPDDRSLPIRRLDPLQRAPRPRRRDPPRRAMTAPKIHDALLEFELVRNQLERALGRGGAPIDLDLARSLLPDVRVALQRLAEVLRVEEAV